MARLEKGMGQCLTPRPIQSAIPPLSYQVLFFPFLFLVVLIVCVIVPFSLTVIVRIANEKGSTTKKNDKKKK